MTRETFPDPFNSIAIETDERFRLSGEDSSTRLVFAFEPALIFRMVLEQGSPFDSREITDDPRFKDICIDRHKTAKFNEGFSVIRSVLHVLSSELIIITGKPGGRNTYEVNPRYTVVDLRTE